MAVRMFRDAVVGDGEALRAINSCGLPEYILLSDLSRFELGTSRITNFGGGDFLATVIFLRPADEKGGEVFYNISSKQRGFSEELCRRTGHKKEPLAA